MYMPINYENMTREELLDAINKKMKYKRSEKGKIAQRKAVARYYRDNKEKVLKKQRETYAKNKLALKTQIVSAH